MLRAKAPSERKSWSGAFRQPAWEVVDHRELYSSPAWAPGIAAHTVKKLSKFRVIYGPIRAEDIPAFLAAGHQGYAGNAAQDLWAGERTVLIPIELVAALKPLAAILPALFILEG